MAKRFGLVVSVPWLDCNCSKS